MSSKANEQPWRGRKRPMFGGPESVMGEGIQKDMDAMVLEDMFALHGLGAQAPAIPPDETPEGREVED